MFLVTPINHFHFKITFSLVINQSIKHLYVLNAQNVTVTVLEEFILVIIHRGHLRGQHGCLWMVVYGWLNETNT